MVRLLKNFFYYFYNELTINNTPQFQTIVMCQRIIKNILNGYSFTHSATLRVSLEKLTPTLKSFLPSTLNGNATYFKHFTDIVGHSAIVAVNAVFLSQFFQIFKRNIYPEIAQYNLLATQCARMVVGLLDEYRVVNILARLSVGVVTSPKSCLWQSCTNFTSSTFN